MNKKSVLIIALVLVISVFSGCKNNEITGDDVNNNNLGSSENITQEGNSPISEEILDNDSIDMNNNEQITESELSALIQKIYKIKDSGLAVGDVPVDLNNMDSIKYYTGLSDTSKVKEIAVSEAMIGSQAYSLVIVQLNKAEDAEPVANEMINGIDPRKWVCVEADDLQIVTQDDLIMLIMISSELKDSVTSQEIVDAFQEVRGGDLGFELKK